MKIIILIIYSENETYLLMKSIIDQYYNRFKNNNIYFYYTEYKEDQQDDTVLVDNIIYVKGKEAYINILYKTVKAFEFINKLHDDYDFLIRTNISTIIDINNLISFLNLIPSNNIYAGGLIINLNWLDPHSGIVDNSLLGLKYIQGTSIILSKNIIDSMIINLDKFKYNLVDDVAIGLYIRENHNNILEDTHNLIKYNAKIYYCATDYIHNIIDVMNCISDNIIFYRHHTENRQTDICKMKLISESLINIYTCIKNNSNKCIYIN
jgi:hypothetical protein